MMRDARSRIAVAAVAVLLGILVVAQLRSQQASNGLENRTAQELTLLVANLNSRNDALRTEVTDLQRQLAAINTAKARGETSAGQVRADLDRIRMWSGVAAAEGPGIRIVIGGNVPAEAISDLINELRNGGAEALAIGDVRVLPWTVVAGDPGSLSVENTALESPIEIIAIGSAPALTGDLTRAGGVIGLLKATWPEVTIEVMPLTKVTIPATERAIDPVFGKAHP